MAQYIPKSALVAEIEKLKGKVSDGSSYCNGWQHALRMLELSLSTLETKDVDLEKELDRYTTNNFWALDGNNESPYLVEKDDMLKVARHFYELGLRAKDVNEIIKTAEDHAYFAGSENTREKLIDKACKWWEEELSYPSMTPEEIKWYKSKVNKFRKTMEE